MEKIKNKFSGSTPNNKLGTQTMPSGFSFKGLLKQPSVDKEDGLTPKVNYSNTQTSNWLSKSDNVEEKLKALRLNADTKKLSLEEQRKPSKYQFSSQKIIQDENEDEWAV